MEMIDLKCKKCGGNLQLDERGTAHCHFCNSSYVLEEAKPDTVIHNTVINNYGIPLPHNISPQDAQEYRKYREEQAEKSLLASVLFGFFFLLFIGSVISNMTRVNEFGLGRIVFESETAPLEEKSADIDYENIHSFDLFADYEEGGVEAVSKMVNLEELFIHKADNLSDYSFLSPMTKLRTLYIDDAEALRNLDFLKGMTSLESLTIIDSGLNDISGLEGLHLIELTLQDNDNLKDYAIISTLKSLKYLRLEVNKSDILPDVLQLKFLEEVNIVD